LKERVRSENPENRFTNNNALKIKVIVTYLGHKRPIGEDSRKEKYAITVFF